MDHANLVVRDLVAATAFYRDRLGLRPVLERRLQDSWIGQVVGLPGAVMDCVILEAPDGGARLELLSYVRPEPFVAGDVSAPHAFGLRHVAFDVDDLDAVWRRLSESGVTLLSEPVEVPFPVAGRRKRLAYLLDPEGVLLELAEYSEMTMEQTIKVPDMMCAACAAKIEAALRAVAGVEAVVCTPPTKTVKVTGQAGVEAIVAAIRGAGFSPTE
ncbi:MAG: VOC family protein [Armatimonadetes bacterium]|nr:VOC family protein [Armatimonadota bacterium]